MGLNKEVKHGKEARAKIKAFQPCVPKNEIKVLTTKGHATLDFLIKL